MYVSSNRLRGKKYDHNVYNDMVFLPYEPVRDLLGNVSSYMSLNIPYKSNQIACLNFLKISFRYVETLTLRVIVEFVQISVHWVMSIWQRHLRYTQLSLGKQKYLLMVLVFFGSILDHKT